MKGDDEPKDPLPFGRSTMAARWFELRVAAGVAMGPLRSWGQPAIDTDVSPTAGLVKRSFSGLASPTFSLDAYASRGINLRSGGVHDQYLAGVSWSF
jgi:hypothetical protein